MTDPVGQMADVAADEHARREEALDALEAMVEQYFMPDPRNERMLDHSFMSAGEFASVVLAQQRPEQWRLTGTGVEYLGELS